MRISDDVRAPEQVDRERLTQLEDRIARLEAHVGLTSDFSVSTAMPPHALAPVFAERTATGDELELQLGQHWFALGGMAILTAGFAFLLSMPYAGAPPVVPALAGFGLATALMASASIRPPSFPRGCTCLWASAMVLLSLSALRLFFFGAQPALDLNSPLAPVVLIAVTAVNVAIALRRRSSWLTGLALTMACVIALAAGTTSLALPSLVVVAMVIVLVSRRAAWPGLPPAGAFLTYATYFAWAMGNPFRTGAVHFVSEPAWAPFVLLALMLVLGLAPLVRAREGDDVPINLLAFVNCALGYGAFLVHTAAVFATRFALLHLIAAVALLGLAMVFFVRTQSRVSTFFYAMTGYAALSAAILKMTGAPDVFVWLSVQSVVVVATAVWFRSRFIVVANFLIFAAIAVTYVGVTKQESGISIGFGLVALATARILGWQQHRLELKTELMRNAYLAGAFLLFPYAAYHLVPVKYVALVWIALASAYYLLNVAVKNQKYRWMGHGTLILTTLYVVGSSVSRLEPIYRVLSFLALGATLLTVSIFLARSRQRQAKTGTNRRDLPDAAVERRG